MNRPFRFRLLCLTLSGLLIATGALRLASATLPLVDPVLSAATLSCAGACELERDPVRLLEPETLRKKAWRTPGSAELIVQLSAEPKVRALLFASDMVRALPMFVMFTALAFALRSLAAGGFTSTTVNWLRRSALASLFWVLAQPVSQSLRWTALSPVIAGRTTSYAILDLSEIFWPAILAGSVFVCLWALQDVLSLQRDLDEYV